jgi:hypothetical protein
MPDAEDPAASEEQMRVYAVRVTERATREALAVFDRIEEQTGDRNIARQWYAGLKDAIGGLATLPHRYPI